jgi:hypothetical protein
MKYATVMTSYGLIHVPCFMKTITGVQVVLRFWLSNLNGHNGRDLRIMPLRWGLGSMTYIPSYTKNSYAFK